MPWCFSRLGLAIVWRRATRSLWCATLFRDIHTAVDAGNVLLRKNFMVGTRKIFVWQFFIAKQSCPWRRPKPELEGKNK
jgi:hypothetical protein